MAVNVVRYARNVAKSFGYAAVDVLGDLNPVIKSFSETNDDLSKELYSAVTDWKGTTKKIKTSIVESDLYEFASAYKKNLFEDLKNGTFYNKTREDEYAQRISGWSDEQLKEEFSDMFDDDDDFNFDGMDFGSDMFMAETIDEVGEKISASNAEVTIRSSEYIVKGQKESTRVLYEQNNRLFGEALKGMAAINANIGQFSGAIADISQTHANNAKAFFENTDKTLGRITELLETIMKNTTPSDDLKRKNEKANQKLSFYDIVDSKGMPNLKAYMKAIKNNIKENSEDMGMFGDLFGTGENVLMSFAASPLLEVTKSAVKQLIPNIIESSMTQFNDTLQGFFGSAIAKINKGKDSDNTVLDWVAKILGIDSELKLNVDPSRYEKGRVAWDGASRKALVEIIPAQLSRIVSALTGEVPSVFNAETGRMESVRVIKERKNDRLQRAVDYAGDDLRSLIDEYLKKAKYVPESYEDKAGLEKDIDNLMLEAFKNGGISAKDLTFEGLGNLNVDNNTALILDLLKKAAKTNKGRSTLLKFNSNILSGRDNYTRTMRRMEQNGSAEMLIENGMFDEFFTKDAKDREFREKTGYKGVRGTGLSGIFDQIDKYGHSMFYYAQEIFKRQDAIYKITGFMAENWGSGGPGGGGETGAKNRSNKIAIDLTDISPDKDAISKTLEYKEKEREKSREKWYQVEADRYRGKNKDYVSEWWDEADRKRAGMNIDSAIFMENAKSEDLNKKWIDKMLTKDTLKGKWGVLQDSVNEFVSNPLESFANMLGVADERMYKLVYGDADKELMDLGFLGIMKSNIEGFFEKTNDWIDSKILEPLKTRFDIYESGDLIKKIIGEERYEKYKSKAEEGLFGTKGEDGRRSGGIFGDYIQSVKDNAKDAWDWTKNSAKEVGSEINDAFGGTFSKWRPSKVVDTYATGGQVKKTGIAAVSEGEIIIPSELNPFYHGKTDKKKQMRDESKAVQKFFGMHFKGTGALGLKSEDDEAEIDLALEDGSVVASSNKNGVSMDTLRYHLRLAQSKLIEKDLTKRIRSLRKTAIAYIKGYAKFNKENKGSGKEAKIIDFDRAKRQYVTDDGQVRNLNPGEWIDSATNGQLSKVAKSAQSFGGDMMSEIDAMFNSVKNVYYRNMKEDGRSGGEQSEVFTDMMDDLKGNFFKGQNYAGAATVGAGIGAGLGMFIGMPFLGAAVGGAIGLTKKSKGVQNFLFGEDVIDEEGNATKKGGIFSKKTQEFIEKKLPGMAKWGLAGAAAGMVLPGGPIVGTMLGASIAYAKDSETLSNVLFSDKDSNGNYTRRGAFKVTKEEFEEKLRKKLPKMGLGAIAGGLIGGPFGIVGNMIVGSAIGFATDSEAFRSAMLGHIGSDGERHGGLIEHVTDNIKGLFGFGKEETKGLGQFFKEDVMEPMIGVIPPLVKEIEMLGQNFSKFGKGFKKVTKAIFGESFKDFGGFLDKPFFNGVKTVAKDVTHGAIGLAKFPLTILPQFAGGLNRMMTRHQLANGSIDYRTAAERLKDRDDIDNAAKNRIENAKGRFKDVKTNFQNKRYLSMVGSALSALGQGAYDISGGLVTDLMGSVGGQSDLNTAFSNMDVWMDNASEEELDEMLKLLYRVQDAGGAWEKEKAGIVETMRGDASSLRYLDQKSRERIFKAASKGSTLVNFNKALSKSKTKDGKGLTDIQRQQIINMFAPGMDRIRDVKLNSIDVEKQAQEAADKLRGNPIFAPLLKDNSNEFDDIRVSNLISQILYEKSAGNVNAMDRGKLEGVEPDSPEAIRIKEQTDFLKEQHDETVDLLKVLINAVTAMGKGTDDDYEIPYADAGAISGVNTDFGRKFRLAQEEKARKAKEEEDFKKKYGRSKNGEDDGRAEVEDVDTGNFYGSHALGGIIGEAIQKNIVSPDGNFFYDAESHEYKAADSETIEKVKRKTNMQDAIIEIPGKLDTLISTMGGNPDTGEGNNDDENGDKTLLGTILDMVGADSKIKDLILGFKNLSWIPMLAGPLLVGGLFSGMLNGPLNSLSQWIQEKLGFGKDTTMNTTFSGDGEVGLDDGLKKGLARDVLTGMSPKGASKILNWGGKSLTKAGEVLSGSKKIRGKIGGWIAKKLGKASTGAGGFASKAEDFLVNGRDILNKKIFGYENGKFKTAMKEGFDTVDGFIFDNATQDFVRGADGSILNVADDVAGEYVDKAAKGAKFKSAINTGLDKLTNISNGVSDKVSSLKSSADDILKKGKNSFKEIGNTIKGLGKRTSGNVAENAIEETVDAATNKGEVSKVVAKFKDWFGKLIEKGKIPSSASKACEQAAEEIGQEVTERAAKGAAKGSTKKGIVATIKAAGPIGWATTVAFALIDFASGYNDAEKVFGIEFPTTADRVVCGLIRSIRGVVEGILSATGVGLAVSLALSMIPDKVFTTIFFNTIGKALAPDIVEKRKEYAEKVDSYNKETGNNYSIEQYETKKKNKKSIGAQVLSDIKYQFSSKYRTRNDSGIEKDGTYIAGFMDESTQRWKKYYLPMIKSGQIDQEYASILYMNECLHDSALKLDDTRRADYEQRIAEYKSSPGAKEVPTITNDLNGLIKTNTVKKQDVKWHEKALSYTGLPYSNMATRTKTVDYGNGTNADNYVGNYATGGVIGRSGYAALSKGEYVVNGKNSLANLIGGLFGSSKSMNYKDYDDLTDVSSVVEDMMSMDTATTDWKKYWSKVDEGVSNSPLSPLKKLLRRIAASLAMPSFALGKVVESVQGMYDSAMGTGTSQSSSQSTSQAASSNSATSYTTSYAKRGGIVGRAVGKVKGFFGKLFGKGSGLYGGASSLDGTFISQMGALGNYGDSSYSDEGCAPATAAMFINSINKGGMTLEQAGDYAVKKGYKVKGDGTKEGFFQDIFANNGIPTENISGKGVLDALKAGKPTVLLGQDEKNASKADSPFGRNPHYVLATGLDANGNVIINDPESSNGGTVYSSKILSKVKSAISTKMQGGRSGLHRNIWKRYGGATDTALVKQQAWAFLRQMGASEACAAGIMGNMSAESGYDPAKIEASSGKGHGLVQWTGSMWTSLQNEANKKGVPWTDLNMQLNLLWKQIVGSNGSWINTYKGNDAKYGILSQNNGITDLASFTGAADPIAVAEVFCVRWERPAVKYAHLDRRRQAAKEAYEEFTGKTIAYDGTVDVGATSVDGTTSAATTDSSNPFGGLFDNLLSKMYGSTAFNTVFGSSASTGADATGGITSTGGTSGGITSSDGSIGQNVAVDAASYLGNPYVWGGNDLNNGIDCSGFVQQMYKKHGFDALAKARGNTKGMWADNYGSKVGNDISSLKPGDVMFFSNNGQASGIHHVGIYVGNNHMIHAQSKNTGIVDTDLANSSKYRSEFIGAERYGAGSGINQNRIANVAKLFGGASSTSDSRSKVLENRKTAQTEKEATGVMKSITRLTQSSGKDGVGLDNLVTSLDSIKTLLEKLVSNTDAIATIANLITELVGLKKDVGTKSASKSSSNSYGLSESEGELQNMVSILTQLAQA